jgi:hypothetical protein
MLTLAVKTAARGGVSRPRHEYDSWYAMNGGRGIMICERWLGPQGYVNFRADVGRRPTSKHSLDRVNVNGNYEPENCRWATAIEQANNLRRPTTPGGLTNAQRQQRKRERLEAAGLVQCNVWVPQAAVAELRLLAEILRAHPHLLPGPLRDPVWGKLVAARKVRVDRC